MSLFEKLNNKRYDLQEKKKFAPGSDGKVPVGGNRNQTSRTTTTTGRVGDLPVDDIPDMSDPKLNKKLDKTEKNKLNRTILSFAIVFPGFLNSTLIFFYSFVFPFS